MKQIHKIIFLAFFIFSAKSAAQLDTLTYLKQFEINKSNYIGYPLSKLLNDMTQIQPKTVWSGSNFKNKNKVVYTIFKFCDMEFSFYNTINLNIEWQNPLLRSDTKSYEQLNHFYFTNDERTFYSSKIVKDIKVYR